MITILAAVLVILATVAMAIRRGGLTRLGGARLELLERATVDTPVFTARGIAAIIPALFGTLAMTVALEYGQQLKLVPAAVGGVVWGLIVLSFDLSIMNAEMGGDSGRSWVRSVIFLALRAVAALLAALLISSMIALFWYRTDVATQLQRDDRAAALSYDRKYIDPQYDPQIGQDQAQVAADQATLTTDATNVASDRKAARQAWLQMQCEAGGVSDLAGCSAGTGRAGRGQVYAVRAAEYQNAKAALDQAEATQQADQARLLPQISHDQADAGDLQDKRAHAESAELAFQSSHDGLLARQQALLELERANPGIGGTVLVVELLVFVLDCTALIAKITSHTLAYDRVTQQERHRAIRRAEQAEAMAEAEIQAQTQINQAMWQAHVDFETAKTKAWGDATSEVERVKTRAWRDAASEVEEARIRAWRDATLADLSGTGQQQTAQWSYDWQS
jgi:hypothetical protein